MGKNRESCEERDGFFFWSHAGDQDKHFFKIMVGDFRERLTIPRKFGQHFLEKITRTVKLVTRGGSFFDVQLTSSLGKLVLGSGWDAFVSAHDINLGDLLVFKYDGNSHFKVLIFDPTCCERSPSSVVTKSSNLKSRMKEPVGMPSLYPSKRKVCRQWDSSNQGNDVINISSSSSSSESSGDRPEGDATFSKGGQEPMPRYILPCGTHLTGMQKKRVKEKIRAIHSEIPIHVSVIKKSNIYGRSCCMNLARGYTDAYLLPFEEQELMLQRNGKIWEVGCSKQVDKRVRLRKGWKKFASDNSLQLGDICLFELLKDKECTVNVHVIRRR